MQLEVREESYKTTSPLIKIENLVKVRQITVKKQVKISKIIVR